MKITKNIAENVRIRTVDDLSTFDIYINLPELNKSELSLALDYSFYFIKSEINKLDCILNYKSISLSSVTYNIKNNSFMNLEFRWENKPIFLVISMSKISNLLIRLSSRYGALNKMIDFRKPVRLVLKAFTLLKGNYKVNITLHKNYEDGKLYIYGPDNIKNELLKQKNIRNFLIKYCLKLKLFKKEV